MEKYSQSKKSNLQILEDPSVCYISGSFFELSMHNISKNYIKKILQLTKLTLLELISIVPISIDTYKRKTTFKPPVTEKILEIEEVYRKGIDVFGITFHKWMDTENIALGSIIPKSLLKNSFGTRLLLDEIGKIEYGVLA